QPSQVEVANPQPKLPYDPRLERGGQAEYNQERDPRLNRQLSSTSMSVSIGSGSSTAARSPSDPSRPVSTSGQFVSESTEHSHQQDVPSRPERVETPDSDVVILTPSPPTS